jgi:excisionase family DNA binding protein
VTEPEFLKVEEIAARMRISKMTAYRLVEHGEFESVRIGRSFRISRDSFERYLAERTNGRKAES